MPSTPIYDLPYEEPGDQPGITLDGGEHGTERILAEEVEEQLERIDADVVSAGEKYLERGWHDITPAGGTMISVATNFAIPSGTFDMVRVYLRGSLQAEGRIGMRLNNDFATSDLHVFRWGVKRVWDDTFIGGNNGALTSWPIAEWGTGLGSTAEAILFNTDVSGRVQFQGRGDRFAGVGFENNQTYTISGGHLNENRLLESLQIRSTAGGDIDSVRVIIEGHKA